MKIRVDGRFARQASELSLCFGCADCFHYLPETEGCAHEWPNEPHKEPPPPAGGEVLFCKEFELR